MWTLRDHGNYPGLSFCTLPLSSLSLSRARARARAHTHTHQLLVSVLLPPPSGYIHTRQCAEKRQMYLARDSGNEKRATNGFSAALVRVHSDETMERGELEEKKEEVTEEVTTGV